MTALHTSSASHRVSYPLTWYLSLWKHNWCLLQLTLDFVCKGIYSMEYVRCICRDISISIAIPRDHAKTNYSLLFNALELFYHRNFFCDEPPRLDIPPLSLPASQLSPFFSNGQLPIPLVSIQRGERGSWPEALYAFVHARQIYEYRCVTAFERP